MNNQFVLSSNIQTDITRQIMKLFFCIFIYINIFYRSAKPNIFYEGEKMTKRENLISLLKKKGYETAPVEFVLCPFLIEKYKKETMANISYEEYYDFPWRAIETFNKLDNERGKFEKYYDVELDTKTYFDEWGIAHEPGSEAAKHMTRMHHPLKNITDINEMKEYDIHSDNIEIGNRKEEVIKLHEKGIAALGELQMTIWETSWYLRSMEEMMIDMMTEDEKAIYILDKVTEIQIKKVSVYAESGVDIIFLGDDIGMQHSTMMSKEFYRMWIKPRLKNVIDSIRKINSEIIIFYHSCGLVTPLIEDLIDSGIDVLSPVQPECMDFKEIYAKFGDRLSFHGTIGTQTTMPFGSVDDVKREVYRNLEIAGDNGGLICAPTHLLEPEVPWANIEGYIEACKSFK